MSCGTFVEPILLNAINNIDAEPQKTQTATAVEENSSDDDESNNEQQQDNSDNQDEPPSFVMGGD